MSLLDVTAEQVKRVALLAATSGLALALATAAAEAQTKPVYMQKYSDARTFDPHKVITRSVSEILAFITDTLVTIDDDLATIKDGLAKEWTVSPDGLTYTFALKDNLKFCDGKAITAATIEANFKRWMDPKTKSSSFSIMGPLTSVTATDAKTVTFKLSQPYVDFLASIASPYAGIVDTDEAAKLGDQFAVTALNGSGPYCFTSWKPREEILLKPNVNYSWGSGPYENKGPVKSGGLVIKIMPEENSRVAALLTGQSDVTYYLPWTSMADIRKNPNFAVVQPRAFGYLAYLGTKVNRPLMEPAVRKAINLAIDRGALVDELYAGEADEATSVISPDFDGAYAPPAKEGPRYDVAMAKKVLDDAGWKAGSDGIRVKNGVRLAPTMIGHIPWRVRLEAIQGMLRDVGMDVKLEITDTPIAVSRIMTKDDFDIYGWYAGYTTTGEALHKYFLPSEPYSAYRAVPDEAKELAALITAGGRELDRDKRNALYKKAQELISQNDYWVPLVHERMVIVYNKTKIDGVKPHGLLAGGLYKGLDLTPR